MVTFEEIKGCDVIFLTIPVDAIVKTIQKFKDISKKSTIL